MHPKVIHFRQPFNLQLQSLQNLLCIPKTNAYPIKNFFTPADLQCLKNDSRRKLNHQITEQHIPSRKTSLVFTISQSWSVISIFKQWYGHALKFNSGLGTWGRFYHIKPPSVPKLLSPDIPLINFYGKIPIFRKQERIPIQCKRP